MRNLFSLADLPAASLSGEFFQPLLGNGALRLERIVSYGHTTPENEWYDQDEDEWVAVIEGEAGLLYADGREIRLARGDHVLIPKHKKHRVIYTSCPCVWLALFADGLIPEPI